ncbi:hypothetical protein BUALT_Bualt14G0112600 [Buddleja alternifolia]|uniref:PB1 domain-containing protein n=1 Tax=Buddleja alternifolia TaxID=168488 RepID=A0AAV6WQQ3_9LAMI|nr:hypothetical protein BUALT_Bualt14G0112600 [Buddleja alternifolia]
MSTQGSAGFVIVEAEYKGDVVKFKLPFSSGVKELREELSRRLPIYNTWFKVKYTDESGKWILLTCDNDLEFCKETLLASSRNKVVKMLVQHQPEFDEYHPLGYQFEASFNHGMNPFVYVTYRHFVSALVLLPFAYFIERKIRPKLTLALFLEIFVLSLLGVSLTLNMYFTSLEYTSPTLLACMVNTIASLTFILAVILRMEIVNIRSPRGIAKVLGTGVSLAGVMTMTLYKGPALKNIGHALVHIGGGSSVIHEHWLKGSLLTIASCVTWSIWYIMQAYTLKRYPAQLSLATWMNFVGAVQSAVFTVIVEHRKAAWTIGFNIDLWSTLYGGVVISGIITFIQLWCTEAKGPVFVTMFNPLSTLLVAILSYFALGEKLYIGSILGGVIVIMGLYLLLWGKEHDEAQIKLKENEDPKTLIFSSDENNLKGEP